MTVSTGYAARLPLERMPLCEPVSFAEELFWSAERDGETAPPFLECPRHLPICLRLSNRLDVPALTSALHEIVERHDPLRSTFREGADGVVRVLRRPEEMPAPVMEVVPDVDPRQVNRILLEELARPFDLESGPLIRARLLRTGEHEHVLSLVVHHIVFDGWSVRVLLRELNALYGSYATGADRVLPDLRVRYGDYVARQRAKLDTEDARRSAAYWEEHLRGARGLALPASPACGHGASPSGAEWFVIDAARTAMLRRLGREHRVTLAVVLATLFKLLLRRLTGSTDVVIGMPVVDRPLGQFDDLIGLFLNLVLLRTDLSGEPDVAGALARVRNTFRGAYQHGHLPYAVLRRRLPDAGGLARVVFNVMNFRRLDAELPGLAVQQIPIDGHLPSLADLSLHIGEVNGRLSGRFIYKANLFEPEDVRAMARQYGLLIDDVLPRPHTRAIH